MQFPASGGEDSSVRAEGGRPGDARVALHRPQIAASDGVPDPNLAGCLLCPVPTDGGEATAVGAERDFPDRVFVAGEAPDLLPRGRIPDPHLVVNPGRG